MDKGQFAPKKREEKKKSFTRRRGGRGAVELVTGFDRVKAGWLEASFEDCIEPVSYTKKIQRKDFLTIGPYPIISQEEGIINGYWNKKADLYKVDVPVIVFGDHTRIFKYIDFDFVLGADGVKLIKVKPFLLPRFLYYQLQTADLDSLGYARHFRLLREVSVTYPPIPEQQRIVSILDEVMAGIAVAKANFEKNLQNARDIFESQLQTVFSKRGPGWVDRRISEIARHSLGKMLDKAKNRGVMKPYLRNLNVRWFEFDLSDLLEMRFLPEESEKYTAVRGDVLICEGGYPGRAAIWNEDYPIYFQKALHRVRFHDPKLSKWFVYYLFAKDQSGELKEQFSGTGIQHFTGEVLDKFIVPIPPTGQLRSEISKFDALSNETQRLAAIYERKLALLEDLKKSLLHRAFAGEL